jgi:hypothetical protein
MTTRRDFLQLAFTAPLLPTSLRLPTSPSGTNNFFMRAHIRSLYAVLCDERFGESVTFAGDMSKRGTLVTRFRGDITEFWYRDLSQLWKVDPVAIAGVTTHGPLFCLERWGWDHGLRVVQREDVLVAGGHEALIGWVIAAMPPNVRV